MLKATDYFQGEKDDNLIVVSPNKIKIFEKTKELHLEF